ncbi:sensor histidine kinase [Clostridium botulinum]|uniref:histidine kinase n=1 Tax=Clostridium botulinum (strain Langeland / NCTC 10281 / Type F) TaxID=441772 RepID=A7GD35_CLOBL|nr:HAMP domain-containing sensor histidine kinase [Clostridium botulinum]ABS40279.1 putative sensor histidine kinase [Clostridium botulinum F str. Langeland]ADF99146.1 putative sensor histidine kinase [Clostridium botulinum F str. 230613]KKM43296.1 histidine kinase [Clostridium botulinum]MBY6791186.1 HAMP domain-containing histidine kinase [Clostridium botulinum]MBY6936417.1 HAMP domain-containing histidine kinase [Clostridium botulinum]
MYRVNIKSGLAIIIYSIILTLVLGIGIYGFKISFSKSPEKVVMDKANVYIMDNNDYKNVISFNAIKPSMSKITEVGEIRSIYENIGSKKLYMFIFMFFIVLVISSFLLWIKLSHIHDKEMKNIIKKLNVLDDNIEPDIVSKSFAMAYENVKNKFNKNLNDYKTLNSYLSHEQKNAISILRTNLEADGNYRYIKFIDNISDSIDDILTLSDIRDDKNMTEVDVSLICASVCDTYRKIYKHINFQFDDESNTTILAKERWIYRAISNLVDNAIKYGGGKPIEVTVKNKNNSVIVTVKDNGIGIEKNSIEKIFNNKYRINELKKDGYGIGLSLVSHVCELCNGFVIAESELNKGSCFYLSFCEYKKTN